MAVVWVAIAMAAAMPRVRAETASSPPVASSPTFGLEDYRSVRPAQPVLWTARNLSGITYNRQTRQLVTVRNQPPALGVLNMEGRVLSWAELPELNDTEAVVHVGNGSYAVVEEGRMSVQLVMLDSAGRLRGSRRLMDFEDAAVRNRGLEGIAFDGTNVFYLAQESQPMTIYRVTGGSLSKESAQWSRTIPYGAADLGIEDLAELYYIEATGNLLVLSQRSKLVLEVTPKGEVRGRLSLRAGSAGLNETIGQPEGITCDADNRIYIVSEPNLLYTFARDAK
jgi:uncharacterized protein YjiK